VSAVRVFGLKLLPVILSAVAMYGVGALIYGFLFADQWMVLSGYTQASFQGEEWRMALGPIMPLLITFGMASLMKGRNIATLGGGLKFGAMIGIVFLAAARMYLLAYGIEPVALFALDAGHLILGAALAGAILGAMKVAD
jgi:Protein of unknown function (DUF1761)